MSGGGSSGGGNSKTTNTPWAAQQPYLKDIFANAASQFETSKGAALPNTQVDPNANIEAGWQGSLDYANTAGQDLTGTATKGFGDLIGTLDVANSPLVQNQIGQANRQVTEDFNRNIMPTIGVDALTAGQYGGSRQGVAEGMAASNAQNIMADQATDIMSDAFKTGSQNAQFAVSQAPSIWSMGNMPSSVQGAVGQDQSAWEQAQLDNQLAQWYFGQQNPWDMLSQYQGLVTGGFGGQTQAT